MPLYRWNADNLEPVTPTTYERENLQEIDLQRLLRDQPDVLEEGLFIVAEEYGDWRDSYRSIDLLALDKKGRLVVAELKRTQTGDHSELQAIRYVAMVANMTLEQIVEAYRSYLSKRGVEEGARECILGHLEVTDESEADVRTESPRIILASAGFSKELTTSVLWLNDNGLDITCIRFRLYGNGDGILVDTDQVIPLPEASDYRIRVRAREYETERRRSSPSAAEVLQGHEDFKRSIDAAPTDSQSILSRLLTWALEVEQEGLAQLSSTRNSWGFSLRVRPPRDSTSSSGLVIIFQDQLGPGLQLWRSVFQRRAPNSISVVERLIAPNKIGQGNTVRVFTDGLLDALTDAYREANGLPATTPRPGSGPDSPPLAE